MSQIWKRLSVCFGVVLPSIRCTLSKYEHNTVQVWTQVHVVQVWTQQVWTQHKSLKSKLGLFIYCAKGKLSQLGWESLKQNMSAPGKNRPPPSAFRPGGKSIFRPFSRKKGGKFWSITCYRKRAEITQNPPSRNVQKKTLNKSMKHYPYTITCFWGCSAKVFSSCLCLWMSLCHCLFFGSGHVSSPLWSNVSKVTSLYDCSLPNCIVTIPIC